MDQVTKIPFGPVDTGALCLHPLHCHAGDLRTLLRKYLLDTVLPALTLLSISVLTVGTIVLVATTVANMGLHLPAGSANADPWAGWCFGPAAIHYDQRADPGREAIAGEFAEGRAWQQNQAESPLDTASLAWPMR